MTSQAGTYTDRSQAEARAFLQHRIGRYLVLYAGLGGLFLMWRVVTGLAIGGLDGLSREIQDPSFGAHALAVAFGLGGWRLTRAGTPGLRTLETIESISLLGSMIGYELMGYLFPPESAASGDTVFLALSFGLFARAIYVPSTGRRSALIGVAAAIPHIVITVIALYRIPEEFLRMQLPAGQDFDRAGFVGVVAGFQGLWWLTAIVLTTAASRVIYGLRKEMRDIKRLGQYQLEKKIGEGGMGIVYRASHAMLQRPTAVKLLPEHKVGEASIARFEREVRLTAKLSHPNTVTIFDFGRTPEGVFYYAMELLRGATLDRVVESGGAMEAARVVHVLSQAASALVEAHGIGLIHRDIKPANIMLCEQGGIADTVKVLDFGLVKEVKEEGAKVTQADVIKGTPQYMPPEAITQPDDVDGRADLYALGAVGFFLLTGEDVFVGKGVVEICSHHLHTAPRPPSTLVKDVPADLEEVILKCLAKRREDRPQSARELEGLLEACACRGQWTSREARAWWSEHPAMLG